MLSAVIIILKEVLEAALLSSILLAVSQTVALSRRWILYAVGMGLFGAGLSAYYFGVISDWLGGSGQEVSNASLLLIVVVSLIGICVWIVRYSEYAASNKNLFRSIKVCLICAVSMTVIREGAEIFVYVSGFSNSLASFLPIFIGGIIGAGIGLSLGVLSYYLLLTLPQKAWFPLTLTTLTLIAAGMASQLALNLIQAGFLPSQKPIWDTSKILPEASILGQLLYLSLGYEATPNAIQMGFFAVPVISVVLSLVSSKRCRAQYRRSARSR